MSILLAHGELGNVDELVFVAIGIIFVIMIGISWWRSRNMGEYDFDNVLLNPPASAEEAGTNHEPDSFKLD